MNILWQGKDITRHVLVRKAVARDVCGGRCDGLDIEFENAESWYRWGPAEDDRIRIIRDGWDSGTLYLNTITPTDGKYRVIATSLPCKARKKRTNGFSGKQIGQIMQQCAAMTGMEWKLWGVDETITVPYILQENETSAAFLHRLAILEGAKLKCVNGTYALIGLDWAQEQKPVGTVIITAEQDGTDYRRNGAACPGITLYTPYAVGKASDSSADSNNPRQEITGWPAMTNIQASRWARNILKDRNRTCESLTVRSTFNPAWSAMRRINVTGGTDADGEWLIEETEHDLKDGKSIAKLHRCILSVS